jgi:hypothetical protein
MATLVVIHIHINPQLGGPLNGRDVVRLGPDVRTLEKHEQYSKPDDKLEP